MNEPVFHEQHQQISLPSSPQHTKPMRRPRRKRQIVVLVTVLVALIAMVSYGWVVANNMAHSYVKKEIVVQVQQRCDTDKAYVDIKRSHFLGKLLFHKPWNMQIRIPSCPALSGMRDIDIHARSVIVHSSTRIITQHAEFSALYPVESLQKDLEETQSSQRLEVMTKNNQLGVKTYFENIPIIVWFDVSVQQKTANSPTRLVIKARDVDLGAQWLKNLLDTTKIADMIPEQIYELPEISDDETMKIDTIDDKGIHLSGTIKNLEYRR